MKDVEARTGSVTIEDVGYKEKTNWGTARQAFRERPIYLCS
jgi:hypothetical protein